MLNLDEDALNARFAAGMDVEALQVCVDNQPDEQIDRSRIFCFWSVNGGPTGKVQSDNLYQTEGTATLRISAPAETWSDGANAIRDQFFSLFRGWRSEDRALKVIQTFPTKPPFKDRYVVDCHLVWGSWRRP